MIRTKASSPRLEPGPAEDPEPGVRLGRAGVDLVRAASGDRVREAHGPAAGSPSKTVVGLHAPGGPTTSPRASSCLSVPARFAATRLTGSARSSLRLCVWSERIRAFLPCG